MKKSDILLLNDSELFVAFNKQTILLVHEANRPGGESKKSQKVQRWIVEEMARRFNLDTEYLKSEYVYIETA